MTDTDKIRLANIVIEFLSNFKSGEDMPIMVGTLNKRQGINGFKVAEIGHPVFEFKDRYFIYLESNDNKTIVTIPYYKETLASLINFCL